VTRAAFIVALVTAVAALVWWVLASGYREARVRDLLGLPPSASRTGAVAGPDFAAPVAEIDAVCRHVVELGGRPTDCRAHFSSIARLDGARLWSLRRDCMLTAAALDGVYACNRAHHPDWPAAE